MVFAISKRGKANGTTPSGRIEVGSWAVGLWCPQQHFEINVWNCFENRAKRLLKTLREIPAQQHTRVACNIEGFFSSKARVGLCLEDSLKALEHIETGVVSLVVTDPPHSDRIPYLELSDFWNAMLQYPPSDFPKEIVISNAKERDKGLEIYLDSMQRMLSECSRVLKEDGFLCLQFNAKDNASWDFLRCPKDLIFCGSFPLEYSARSLVQDNRKGAMKSDFVLIYRRSENPQPLQVFDDLPGWSTEFPKGVS
jgi:adenine-specific DNA methylase